MKIKLRQKLSFNIISALITLLIFFGIIASTIGYTSFTSSLKREYTENTAKTAQTAATLINGDGIDGYLSDAEAGTESEEHKTAQEYLDIFCDKMDVSLIYVIKVDTSDYGSFVSVFNSVNKEETKYSPWAVGYKRDTTNEEYRNVYRDIYEKGLEYGTVYRTTDLNGAVAHITSLVPVKNSSGQVVSILCVQRPMSELAAGRGYYLIKVAIATVILAIIVVFSAYYYVKRQFVSPLSRVKSEAERFANEGGEPKERLNGKISNIEEISTLAVSVDKMERDIEKYVENIKSITADKQRIGTELDIASKIQQGSIPSVFPAFPDRKDFDIYASMTPAKEVGGDFYDFFFIDENRLALVIADVSGKGVPAALFMMITKILIKIRALIGGTPAEILSFVNDRICENNRENMFITVWLGIIDLSSGQVTAANAGHEDPAVYRKDGKFELFKTKHGLTIGAVEGIKYKNYTITLEKGDKLFLYTDGVPEATDKDDKLFGLSAMVDALNKNAELSPKEILDGVRSAVNGFVKDAPQFDDLTMLCLEMKGEKVLKIPAAKENLDKVNEFIFSAIEEDCPQKIKRQIELAVEEIFVNIANYAYGQKEGEAEIAVYADKDSVKITFKDGGTPYNPLAKEDPNVSLGAKEREIGGLGVYLVKKTMDSADYEYKNGKNVFTIVKKIK